MDLLPNEIFALECIARYAREGLVVDSSNGQFAHCPYPKGMGDKGYYLTFEDHQHQGLLQSKDVGRRCFWIADVKLWLDTYPPNYFELYGIFEEYISGKHCPQFGVPKTEEWKKAQSERMSGEKNHRFGVSDTEAQKQAKSERMSGENHPQYGRTGALCPNSKAIIAIKPDGTELHFGGGREAARELGIDTSHLSNRYLKTGKSPTRGKFKGWRFVYAAQ
jgi:hypothetical protein